MYWDLFKRIALGLILLPFLSALSSRYIVQFIGIVDFKSPTELGFLTEYVDNGDLAKHMGALSISQIKSIALDIAHGLAFLHGCALLLQLV